VEKSVVLFDGDCGICTWSADWINARDRERNRLQVVPSQLADLQRVSPGLTPEMTSQSVYFISDTGKGYKEARAVFEILKCLPGIWHFIGVVLANPVCAVLAWPLYRLVADNRQRISIRLGMMACAVPQKPPAPSQPDKSTGNYLKITLIG